MATPITVVQHILIEFGGAVICDTHSLLWLQCRGVHCAYRSLLRAIHVPLWVMIQRHES